ncbi:MAG: cobalamin-binding protein [Nitrospirota bacterium]|jgi:iron complex transport system substrate-binding protein|nr:cobalamin-binding protein [Nitrospirota bacterium]MDH4361033.1 cobalamin-binding protein [Nitrospirota bacterium]MDH5295854.1 cobalamin-binding protein [Nitrospirota bacterium]
MKNRVQSSGLFRPWGFFILGNGVSHLFCVIVAWWTMFLCGVLVVPALAFDGDTMKRRQQGILTGMPFMSNVAPRTFVDDLGRKLYLAKPPQRIVSLAPSITEILFAIGLNEEIVGVTEFCDFPPEALIKPKVGYATPNLEMIVGLQPQLVLAPRSFLRVDLLNKLEQLKIPTFILDPHTVEDIFAHIQLLGRMVGRPQEANAQAALMRKQLAGLSSRLADLSRPTLLYILNSEPLITVGPGSFIHRLIELAGGRNAADQATAPYPHLTMEEVLRQNPDILLFPVGRHEGIPQAEQDSWRRWTTLSAVQHGKLFQVDSDLLNRPGPRILEGLKQLVKILHPEVIQDDIPN